MSMYHEGSRERQDRFDTLTVPGWKRRPEYRDHLPARDLATLGAEHPTGEDDA